MCVCVRERERERERETECYCLCKSERKREREKNRKRVCKCVHLRVGEWERKRVFDRLLKMKVVLNKIKSLFVTRDCKIMIFRPKNCDC